MRRRGYALSELLVAIAIAGLIIGVLTFLNVDYISLGRRVSDIASPYTLGTRAEAGDPCAAPGGVLTDADDAVIAHEPQDNATVLSLAHPDTDDANATQVSTAAGLAGETRRPVRVLVEDAPARGPSVASVEIAGATVGVIAQRCDLPQICTYDAANAICHEDEAVAEPG
jgi:prepilin-type N-terminal cleavage/methylation domain-containing protein